MSTRLHPDGWIATHLQDGALALLARERLLADGDCLDGLIEDIRKTLLRQSTALQVGDSADVLGERLSLSGRHWLLRLATEVGEGCLIVAEIDLGADKHDLRSRSVVLQLGDPLGAHVGEGGGVHNGEAEEKDISAGVGERPQAIVILLTGGIPETERNLRCNMSVERISTAGVNIRTGRPSIVTVAE